MSHIHVANTLFKNNGTNSFLFLEEDFEVVQPAQPKHLNLSISLNDSALNIARFVDKDITWQFLRLGYNPRWRAKSQASRCKPACICRITYPGICFIMARKIANESCWIGSAVQRLAMPCTGVRGWLFNDAYVTRCMLNRIYSNLVSICGFLGLRGIIHLGFLDLCTMLFQVFFNNVSKWRSMVRQW
jgi:hypothetical protein